MLTGQQPVSSRDRENDLKRYRKEPQKQDVSKFVINKILRRAILKGMELNPKRRPQSISDWLKLLEPAQEMNLTDILRWVIGVIYALVLLGAVVIPLISNPSNQPNQPTQYPPSSTEWPQLEYKGLSAISKFADERDTQTLKKVIDLFEQNKNKYQGKKEFEELFSELTRRYAQNVLAISGEPGIRKGIEKLEEIQQRLDQNFDIENLPEDDIIAQEYKDVSALL
ncbi:hypothetical protein [Moorena bouillonii]|uniref:Uncharacterized protein n=1 Tax=Moorena bouillonii PNG TaxID=568701 RepID=A0A1U7N2K4_9CYAN|nr:hypothetical protein [Moorena bouillonii]OLT60141.1 hypothetical protein BJP37_15025 [Moorena bouillonii PNG]